MNEEQIYKQGFTLCDQLNGFSMHIGPFYQRPSDTLMQRAMLIEQQHLNPEGVAHGGALMSFMDFVMYRAIGDDIGHKIQFASININTQFLSAAKRQDLILGEGNIVRKTRSVIFAQGSIRVENTLIMSASGIYKIIGNY